MHIVTSETKAKRLQAVREKIAKTTDGKEKAELGREAREIRSEQPKS